MKKTLFIITALAALSLASCKKEEKTETIKEISDIRFEVAQPGTKAVKSNWEKGDEIMILFYEKMEVGQQAKLRYDGSVWQVVQKPKNLSYAPGTNVDTYEALHYPGEMVYNGQDDDWQKIMNYHAGIVLWQNRGKRFDVSSEGVINLGTITLESMNNKVFQVVVPGITAEENYSLSVTCNGSYITAENNTGYEANSYVYKCWPYFDKILTYGGGFHPIYGVKNPDGVEFLFCLLRTPTEAATSPYKYVFALSDGTQLYYYTIENTSPKTIAEKSAIKLPPFDGKGAQTYWKTTL